VSLWPSRGFRSAWGLRRIGLRRRGLPLMGFRGTPWTRTIGCRAVMGSAPPVRRSPPFGPSIRQPSPRPKPAGGPPCAFAPLQRTSPRIRTALHRSGDLRRHSNERHMLPLLDFDHPTAHASVVDPYVGGGSLRHRVPRRGLATSFATFTTGSCDPRRLSAPHACRRAMRTGAPMGFALQGVSLDRDRSSSRSPMPSCRCTARPPTARGRWGPMRGRLQGLCPAASPCRHRCAESKPSSAPAADPFLGFRLSRA
jgi:hypothetical protein